VSISTGKRCNLYRIYAVYFFFPCPNGQIYGVYIRNWPTLRIRITLVLIPFSEKYTEPANPTYYIFVLCKLYMTTMTTSTRVTHNFYVISDPQIGHDRQEVRAAKKTADVLALDDKDGVIIIPGDLTHYGLGSMDPFTKYLCMCFCIRKARNESLGDKDELRELDREHVAPLSKASKDVLMCVGNHDSLTQWWTGHNPAYGYVKDRFGGLVYEREIFGNGPVGNDEDGDSIMVYSLSEWPKKKTVDWLAAKLVRHFKPFVLFFHYNLEGPFSDWWKPEEKEYLYEVGIRPHKDRLAFIAEGHHHSSYVKEWKGITVVNGGGDNAIRVSVHVSAGAVSTDAKLL